jgi:hypothetical protein
MTQISPERVAKDFVWFGWTGVWVQLLLATVPVLLLCRLLFSKAMGNAPILGVTDYLAIVGLAILLFTTFWSWRYASLGARLRDPARRPTPQKLSGVLWCGLWAGCVGIAVSLMLLFVEVLRLLILFLKTPQGGLPVIQTQPGSRSEWVSAIDVVTLFAEVCTLAGELVVVGFTLWLLFRVTRAQSWPDEAAADASAS